MVKSKQFIRPRLYGLPERVSPLLMADKSTLATPRTQGSIIVYYTLIHKHYYVNGENETQNFTFCEVNFKHINSRRYINLYDYLEARNYEESWSFENVYNTMRTPQ